MIDPVTGEPLTERQKEHVEAMQRAISKAENETRDPLPSHGWSPGEYLHYSCDKCGSMFVAEKYAWRCADCAYAEYLFD